MATEKKTTARKAATKKATAKKPVAKKGSEGCGKAYRTREERPISGRL